MLKRPTRSRLAGLAPLLFVGLVLGRAAPAEAHTLLVDPPPRDGQDGYKPTRTPGFVLPCGVARSASQPITHIAIGPDLTRTVRWTETVNHPGCFLLEFAASDQSPFQQLKVIKHAATGPTPRPWQADITLPATPCTGCILRLRQVMLNTETETCPPAGLDDMSPDLYYSCANLVLDGDGGPGDLPDASTATDAGAVKPRASSGCSVAGPAEGLGASLALAVMLGLLWRRRFCSPRR